MEAGSELNDEIPKTAVEILAEEQRRGKMSTGASDLDSLIGGIEEGCSYLFYGDSEITTMLVHQILAKCSLPQNDGGFDSNSIYFNNTDYYTARTTLSPTLLGEFAKKMDINPERVFRSVHVVAAYNEERQKLVAERVCEFLRTSRNEEDNSKEIKVVVVHNATCFLPGSTNLRNSYLNLTQVIGALKAVCSGKVSLIVTAGPVGKAESWRLPKTMGGSFFQAFHERYRESEEMEWGQKGGPSISPGYVGETSTDARAENRHFETASFGSGSLG